MGAIHLSALKKKAREEKAAIVFEDEASFRQSTTLQQTWAPLNSQPKFPCLGKRKSIKVYGAVCPETCRFDYRTQKHYFDTKDYVAYLEESLLPRFYKKGRRVFLIHDNASYHRGPELREWMARSQKVIHIEPLPSYSPELNASEKIWKYTRKSATHNVYFATDDHLLSALHVTFEDLQRNPHKLQAYMRSFL